MRKTFLLSKTFWLNLIVGAVGFFEAAPGIMPQEWTVPILAGLNIVLRFLTNQPESSVLLSKL